MSISTVLRLFRYFETLDPRAARLNFLRFLPVAVESRCLEALPTLAGVVFLFLR